MGDIEINSNDNKEEDENLSNAELNHVKEE